nr:MAG TPA: hypothetical protein [Caudoviricetes sp.]
MKTDIAFITLKICRLHKTRIEIVPEKSVVVLVNRLQ